MNTRYDTDRDLEDLHESLAHDREISLGTTTIIGIFFALALLCAAFFGFGYSMGRKSAQTTVPTANQTASTDAPESDSAKPSPESLISQSSAATTIPAVQQPDNTPAKEQAPQPPAPIPVKAVVVANNSPAPQPVKATIPAKPAVLAPAVSPPPAPGIAAMVQVAAVSHQEDADILATALKKRGYTVVIRQVPQDKLMHVQIGPFATKKDADAMKQRLQTDGYNAIVK